MDITLQDLIGPLDVETFLREHWLRGRHHLSTPSEVLTRVLGAVDEFADVKKLLARVDTAMLFGPKGFRSTVPAKVAYDFYLRGDTLYLRHVDAAVPAAAKLFEGVVQVFGIDGAAYLEAFAAKGGGLSTLHYDHDANFQILLRGTKRWRVLPNAHITNPSVPHHDLAAPHEEAYASRLPLPDRLDAPIELVATPGTAMFFPAGYWHEVETSEDAFAVNFVFNPPRWPNVLAQALVGRLMADPELRGHSFGLVGDEAHPVLREHAARVFERLRDRARQALDEVSAPDLGVAHVSEPVRWAARAADRSLREDAEGAWLVCPRAGLTSDVLLEPPLDELVRQILPFRGWFTHAQLGHLAPSIPAESLLELLRSMTEMGLLERAP